MKKLILVLGVLGLSACGSSIETTKDVPAAQVTRPNSDVVQTMVCDGHLDGWPLDFFYEVETFASGDVFATGWVASAGTQGSDSLFYAPNQPGYDTAAILFPLDVAGAPNFGEWVLSARRDQMTVLATYTDSDVGVVNWNVANSCTVTFY